jgi:Asp-tRNA(Asn)/Glu-tRNA(Gln) amidotransferase C subunit
LPNLFGINPIEASLIFGVLYYLYGPDELYGDAREAGKFVSTYGPIVKDLAYNIYNEFKEYIDEDRQRDELSKRGIDISKIPRRTTNIIERIQESLEMFSEMTQVKSEISEEIQSVIQTNPTLRDDDTKRKQRKKKKELLEEKNVDIEKLITADSSAETNVSEELSKSLSLVQERLTSLTSAREAEISQKGLFGDSGVLKAASGMESTTTGDEFRPMPLYEPPTGANLTSRRLADL